MWKVNYIVSRSASGKSHRIGFIKIVGGDDLKRTYIYNIWIKRKIGNKVLKIFNGIKRKSFDKSKYKGDERLARYLLKYFGPGKYSLMRQFGGKKGSKSVFYGFVGPHHFTRYKRYNEILVNDSGLSPHLTSTKPIGGRHGYQS